MDLANEYYFTVTIKPPDLNKLRLTLKGELTKIWAILSDNLEDEIDEFAKKLYEKEIIGKRARKMKDYETMMDTFVSSMAVFDTVEKFEGHCSTLLDILADIRGAAKITGATLRQSWKIAVKNECGIKFLINYGEYVSIISLIISLVLVIILPKLII